MKKSLLITILMFCLSLLSFGATNKFDFQKRTVKLNNGIEMPIIGIGVFIK
ncbi:hypothetical protein OCK72_05265 [Fusobacterium simiae]|uniref:Uncharacterized protein n=1 Tax=Fusobacterium simiae TaxID=855 RepID=A0ABT4DHI5_FUSSI|nr:hypothetical protein [Fusobacterium simiae]MCY7008065.1 hypothetical protein [Fusobacterium simiae]